MKNPIPKCVEPWAHHSWMPITGPIGCYLGVCLLEFCPHCGIFVWRDLHDGNCEYQGRLLRKHAFSSNLWRKR